jgi:hypothetical protein
MLFHRAQLYYKFNLSFLFSKHGLVQVKRTINELFYQQMIIAQPDMMTKMMHFIEIDVKVKVMLSFYF